MKKRYHIKWIVYLLSICLCFMSMPYVLKAQESDVEIVVYHTNDMHGSVSSNTSGVIGLDKVATLKKNTPNALLVDAGDATQGLPFASLSKGKDVIEVMNAAGYDAMAMGNHEFDYGVEQLLENASKSQFPFLAANVYKNGKPLLENIENNGQNVIIEIKGIKVGIFALTTQETRTATNPEGIVGVSFEDEIETAKAQIDALEKQQCDVLIALTHIGNISSGSCTTEKLANALTGQYQDDLDVIIDGHSHESYTKEVNGVDIVQTGTGLTQLGKVTFSLHDDMVEVEAELLSSEDLKDVESDIEVASKIDAINASQKDLLEEELYETKTSLWGGVVNGIAEARLTQTNLGNLTADAYRYNAERFLEQNGLSHYDVLGVVNGGGLRETITQGSITRGDLLSVFPFSNTLIVKEVTPKQLIAVLENSVKKITGQDETLGYLKGDVSGGYLQISGFRFSYDPNAVIDKVKEVVLDNGTILDRNDNSTKLAVVSNNFIMNGGNEYTMFTSCKKLGEISGEIEAIETYLDILTEKGTKAIMMPVWEKRIVTISSYVPKKYEAKIQLISESDSVSNREVSYYVDGKYVGKVISDEMGILHILLDDGAHSIKIFESGKEVYVNNYSGTGVIEAYTKYPTLEYVEEEIVSKTYKITYVLNGGTNHLDNPVIYETGKQYVLKPASKKGYEFVGWYLDQSFTQKIESIDPSQQCDITLYAKWKKVDSLSGVDTKDDSQSLYWMSILLVSLFIVLKMGKTTNNKL